MTPLLQLRPEELSTLPIVGPEEHGLNLLAYDSDNPARIVRIRNDDSPFATKDYVDEHSGGIPEAPQDGTPYARKDAGWVPAGSPPAPYNLGNITGEFGVNISDGPLQQGVLTGDALFSINGGVLGDKLTLQLEWTDGVHTVDFSGVKYPPGVAELFPVTLESLRCYRFNFVFVGGGWSLDTVSGPYTESVD